MDAVRALICAFLGRQYSISKGDPDTLTGPQPAHELLQQGSIPMPEPGRDRAALRPAGQTERALGKEAGLWLGKVKALQVSHGFFFFSSLPLSPSPPPVCCTGAVGHAVPVQGLLQQKRSAVGEPMESPGGEPWPQGNQQAKLLPLCC